MQRIIETGTRELGGSSSTQSFSNTREAQKTRTQAKQREKEKEEEDKRDEYYSGHTTVPGYKRKNPYSDKPDVFHQAPSNPPRLFLQLFIGSASAKIFLVMPIVLPITNALGVSPQLVILTYCMADGFTDVILPTNPVLLIGLSMAKVSYWKWLKWTWKLQLALFLISVLVLFFGVLIGY